MTASEPVPFGMEVASAEVLCAHEYVYLRTVATYDRPTDTPGMVALRSGEKDVFYCTRCLEYREIVNRF